MRIAYSAIALALLFAFPSRAQMFGRSSHFGDLVVKCNSNGWVTAVESGMPPMTVLTDLDGTKRFSNIHIGKYVVNCPDGAHGTVEVKPSKATVLDLTEHGEQGVLQGQVFQCGSLDEATMKPSNCRGMHDLLIRAVNTATKQQRDALSAEQGLYSFNLPPDSMRWASMPQVEIATRYCSVLRRSRHHRSRTLRTSWTI